MFVVSWNLLNVGRKSSVFLTICLCIFQLRSIQASIEEDEIIRRFEPIAMDESWSMVKNAPENPDIVKNPRTLQPAISSGHHRDDIDRHLPGELPDLKASESIIGDIRPPYEVEEKAGKNIDNTLFYIPEENSSEVSKLVTGDKRPTFIRKGEPLKPVMSKGKNGKIIAKYRLLIPIFLPALRNKAQVLELPQQKVNYTQETLTELVPMQKTKPSLRTVIKAERVPQQVITEYIKTDNGTLPAKGSSELRPGDQLLTSVVKSYP